MLSSAVRIFGDAWHHTCLALPSASTGMLGITHAWLYRPHLRGCLASHMLGFAVRIFWDAWYLISAVRIFGDAWHYTCSTLPSASSGMLGILSLLSAFSGMLLGFANIHSWFCQPHLRRWVASHMLDFASSVPSNHEKCTTLQYITHPSPLPTCS